MKTRLARLLMSLSLLCVWFAPLGAAAQPGIQAQTRAVIEAQLAAFKQDDANSAFSHATPNIQVMFQTPQNFLTMVREDYNVVYRPQSIQFIKFAGNEEQAIHTVQMTDKQKVLWNVYYVLQNKGPDGWKISSCQIEKVQAELI